MRHQGLSAHVRTTHKEEPPPHGGSASGTYHHVSGLGVSLASGSLAALRRMPVSMPQLWLWIAQGENEDFTGKWEVLHQWTMNHHLKCSGINCSKTFLPSYSSVTEMMSEKMTECCEKGLWLALLKCMCIIRSFFVESRKELHTVPWILGILLF